MKFPHYSRKEKQAFKKVLEIVPKVRISDNIVNENEKGLYISFCKYCGALNQHEVILADLGEKIKKLQCVKCNQWYKIKPSPFIFEEGK